MGVSAMPPPLLNTVLAVAALAATAGADDVVCGKSTTVPINDLAYKVRPGESYTLQTRKITRRCVVTYEAAGGCTSLRLKCPNSPCPTWTRTSADRVTSCECEAIPSPGCQRFTATRISRPCSTRPWPPPG